MRVLKRGREQSGWSIEAKCTGAGNGDGGCGARLLVEQRDLYRTESHARDETFAHATFQCGQCHVLTDLPMRKVPSRVFDAMKHRGPKDWPRPPESQADQEMVITVQELIVEILNERLHDEVRERLYLASPLRLEVAVSENDYSITVTVPT